MTGAGRTLKASTHSGAVLENVAPYRVGAHQHVPEITQLLGFPVSFTPHLLPVRRGLIATCNVRSTGADLRALLEEAYAGSPVVTVLPEGMAPELARVQHSDRAEIGVFDDRFTDRTDRHLRRGQPRQGRSGPGDPEREPRPRLRADGRACGSAG